MEIIITHKSQGDLRGVGHGITERVTDHAEHTEGAKEPVFRIVLPSCSNVQLHAEDPCCYPQDIVIYHDATRDWVVRYSPPTLRGTRNEELGTNKEEVFTC